MRELRDVGGTDGMRREESGAFGAQGKQALSHQTDRRSVPAEKTDYWADMRRWKVRRIRSARRRTPNLLRRLET